MHSHLQSWTSLTDAVVYSLTDEVSRHNFELFGHPDGKQEFSQGIALPSWVVESSNKWYVMAAYALILGVLLPVLVVSACVQVSRSARLTRA
jgi:preprotein translocase subunit Sec63